MTERTAAAAQAADAACKYPGCTRLPEPASGKPGRPPEYCDDPEHNAVAAWRERKRLEAEAGGPAVPALAETGQPVTMARATAVELVREVRALADREQALVGRLIEAAAIIGDPGAFEAEGEAVRAAAELRATTAESALATAEQLAGAAARARDQADEAAALMDTARGRAEDRAREAAEQLAAAQRDHAADLARIREEAQAAIGQARQEAETAIGQARQEAETAIGQARQEAETAIGQARQEADAALAGAARTVADAERARDAAQDSAQQAEKRATAADARATAAAEQAGRDRQSAAAELDRARESADRQLGQLTERLAVADRAAADAREDADRIRADADRQREELREAFDRPGTGPRGVTDRPPAAGRPGRAGPGRRPRGEQATPRCRRLTSLAASRRRPPRPGSSRQAGMPFVSPARAGDGPDKEDHGMNDRPVGQPQGPAAAQVVWRVLLRRGIPVENGRRPGRRRRPAGLVPGGPGAPAVLPARPPGRARRRLRTAVPGRGRAAMTGDHAAPVIPANRAAGTGYHARYVRLGAARRRITAFAPLGPGLAAADMGVPGGMIDQDHAAGKPSRREREIVASWMEADVPPELEAAQFDIATLLAEIERLRDADWMATRNMIQAEHRAHVAEQMARKAPSGQLADLLARAYLRIAYLERMLGIALGPGQADGAGQRCQRNGQPGVLS